MTTSPTSQSKQLFDVALQALRLGDRTEALNHLALAVDQKLSEVPLDRVHEQTALLFFEVLIDGVGV